MRKRLRLQGRVNEKAVSWKRSKVIDGVIWRDCTYEACLIRREQGPGKRCGDGEVGSV